MGLLSPDSDQLNIYGYKFKWGPLHQTPEELQRHIHTYDTVAAEALDALDEIVPPAKVGPRKDIQEAVEVEGKKHRDLYSLVKEHAKTDERVGRLWDEVNTVPEWVDWEQIDRGQKVFWRYGGPAITALTFLSLLGGMGSGRTVETLDRTGGFGAQVVRRRLLETTQHTLGVHKDLEAIKPGGVEGFESSVRVRLLHASVRQRVLKLAREKPEYYDLKKYGVPVNDLDCIGTIGTFSATIIWMGLPRQGIFLRPQEIADYLALWRYVAYLMGTPHDWLETPETARAMMESLLVSEVKPTKKSGTLANNIITGFEGQAPTYASRGFLNAETYWLNGEDLSRELNIEKPNLYYTMLVIGQCLFFMITGYINRMVPSWDERNIKIARKVLYDLLVHNKKRGALGYKTKFNFKWIPDLENTTTPLGEPVPGQAEKSGALRHVGVERTALMTLVFTGVVVGLTAWGVWSGFRAVSNVALGISSGSPSLAGLKAPIWEFSKMVKR
ncbi:tat pathway signal sequence [Pestalotiopsis sp. NC0098]|nr:tat pathway signal sequence [Pestalotiopsis sp. NC0098]